ncbi:MAG: hypothetical protein ACFFGZ_00260 [Candidatus Thorarchaeota archaeon]
MISPISSLITKYAIFPRRLPGISKEYAVEIEWGEPKGAFKEETESGELFRVKADASSVGKKLEAASFGENRGRSNRFTFPPVNLC